jgi:hypothetical protein
VPEYEVEVEVTFRFAAEGMLVRRDSLELDRALASTRHTDSLRPAIRQRRSIATEEAQATQSQHRHLVAAVEARAYRCREEVDRPAMTGALSRTAAEGTCADARSDSCAHTEPCSPL